METYPCHKLRPLSKRKRKILEVLEELGGTASTREIASAAGLNVNGVSQTLGCMNQVETLADEEDGPKLRGGDTRWTRVRF